jgi:hypothetical protein
MILYFQKFKERCIALLTSITSKKVRLHLLYALLTYFLVMLGSMGTGEDLFYKCYAHFEELSTHIKHPRKFSMKFGTMTMSTSFLINNIYYIYIMTDIYTFFDKTGYICSCLNNDTRQGYFEHFSCD